MLAGKRRFFYVFDLEAGAMQRISLHGYEAQRSLERFEVSPDQHTLAFLGTEGTILLISAKVRPALRRVPTQPRRRPSRLSARSR